MTVHQEQDTASIVRGAAVAIALGALVSIVAVALDSAAQGSDPLAILQSMVRIRESHQLVHVVAMGCIGSLMFGFTVLSQRLGLRRAPVVAGLIAYAAGSMLMLVATIIDGFISTDTAAMFAKGSPEAVRAGYWMIQTMAGVALTDIARVAWICQAVAAVASSLAMLREAGLSRKLGIAGMVTGALPGVAVVAAGANMTETVVVGILLVQGAWNLVAASYLWWCGAQPQAKLRGAALAQSRVAVTGA
jgi:hypothetical protein